VALLGDDIAIYCPAWLNVTWLFEGDKELPSNVRKKRDGIVIRNLRQENTGIYSCRYPLSAYVINEVQAMVEVTCMQSILVCLHV